MSKTTLEAIAEKAPCALVEFRGQKLVERKYVDQKTGKAAEFRYVSVSAEFQQSGQQLTLEFVPPKGTEKLELFPITKGQRCVVELGSYTEKDGHVTARLRSIEPVGNGGPLKVEKPS